MTEQDQTTETEQILDTPLPGEEQEVVEKDTEVEEKPEEKDSTEETVEEETDKPKKKKVSGFTRRLNRERERAAAAEARAQDLEARLNAQKQPETKSEDGEPDPNNYEHGINDINYITELADFRGTKAGERAYQKAKEKDIQLSQQYQAANMQQKAADNFMEKLDEAEENHDDLKEVLESSTTVFPDATLYAIHSSEVAGELAYYLAKNPKTEKKIATAHPIDAAKMIGNIERKLSKPATGTPKTPKPIKPVGSGKTSTKRDYSDDMTQEDFNDNFSFDDLNKY